MASPRQASSRRNSSGVRRTGVGWARRISSRWGLADCSRRCYGQQALHPRDALCMIHARGTLNATAAHNTAHATRRFDHACTAPFQR
jgi:hypothetical protein